jgi:hypothetical protein
MEQLLIGPVLSFRGIGKNNMWQVTALIGVRADEPVPEVHIDGHSAGRPRELLLFRKERYLRYDLACKMQRQERRVAYGIVNGPTWHFTVPALGAAPRMAYVSCNGFSDPSGMRKLVRPAHTVWQDLLESHDRLLRPADRLLDKEQLWHEERIHDQGLQRFHVLLMGGDQIYFDSIWEDIPALKHWVSLSRQDQLAFKVPAALERDIEEYYFTLYRQRWLPEKRKPWNSDQVNHDAADAMARTPTVMMWDDHDIFDGWGSYSCAMQACELFTVMFRHARRAFWVFQMQHALDDLPTLEDGTRAGFQSNDPLYRPTAWSTALARDPLALPMLEDQPGFTSVYQLGPLALVCADLRTERSRTQVMGPTTWSQLKRWLAALPAESGARARKSDSRCEHVLFMSSVPVAHPKLSLAEGLLDTFGQDHVIDSSADDLKDHWSHDDHEGERKRLLEVLSGVARDKQLRVSLVSGDVHVAAWGTMVRRDLPLTETWAQIHQFTSSAVVHPSLMGVAERLFLSLLNSMASKPQHIDVQYTVEMMLFPGHNKYVMPARNWLALEVDDANAEGRKLWATWRCETETGFSNHLLAVPPATKK